MAQGGNICYNITSEEQLLMDELDEVDIRDASSSESINYFSDDSQDDNLSDLDDYSTDEGNLGFMLRNYQKELAQVALNNHNCIICAPTGSGKTNVAIYIILEHLKNYPDAKVAFLARTVPLAKQQYLRIKKQLPREGKILLVIGESEFSMRLHHLLPNYNVMVMTPMILVNHLVGKQPLLTKGIAAFSLLVFDECHHTCKDDPYNNIMYYYLKEKRQRKKTPQVLGLTASLGVGRASEDNKAEKNIMKLCGNLDVDHPDHVVMVKRYTEELRNTVPIPKEGEQNLVPIEMNEATRKILDIMDELERKAAQYAREGKDEDVSTFMDCMPPAKKHPKYCQWVVGLANAVKVVDPQKETVMSFQNLGIVAQLLKECHFALEAMELAQAHDVISFLEGSFANFKSNGDFYKMFEELKEVVSRQDSNVNRNLKILAETLRSYVLEKGTDTCAIIFVRTRMLAHAVSNWLCKCGEDDLMGLNARKFTSTNKPEEQGGMSESQQKAVLDQFQSGEVRVLVATSVAEEGLDIPQCNLVVKYNHTSNEVGKVQTRGRSRAEGGVCILLGLPDILQREQNNCHRLKLMEAALTKISQKSPAEMKMEIKEYHTFLYQEWDLEEQIKDQERLKQENKNCKVYCHLCKKVGLQSSKIRTIYGKYYVSIDRDLLNHIKIESGQERMFDGLPRIGQAKCLGLAKTGETCPNKIGPIIKHNGCYFVTLGKKNVVFQCNEEKPKTIKQWKDVPFNVEELSPEDFLDYAKITFPVPWRQLSS